MDGVFVPNISFGMPVIKAINKHAKKTMDVHLMIVDPDRYIKQFTSMEQTVTSLKSTGEYLTNLFEAMNKDD